MSGDLEHKGSADIAGIADEYSALRDEIVKRIGLRQQSVSIALTMAGVFLGIGATTDTIALVYPLLATFLAIGWAQNDLRIKDAATYIREHLESATPHLGWETHIQKRRQVTRRARYVVLSHGGIFVFTQLAAIGIGVLNFTATPVEWALLVVDILAVLAVLWVARLARR